MPDLYSIEKASKGGKCIGCSKSYPENEVVFSYTSSYEGVMGSPMLYHTACVPKKYVVNAATGDDVTEIKGFSALSTSEQEDASLALREIIESTAVKRTASKKATGGATKKAKKEPKEKKEKKEKVPKKEKKAPKEKKEPKEKKAKGKKEPVDPDAPVKPPTSGYMLFTKNRRAEVVKEYPNAAPKEIMSLLGTLWKELAQDEKDGINKEVKEMKEKYTTELAAYTKKKEANGDTNGNGNDDTNGNGDDAGDEGKATKKKAPAKKRTLKKKTDDDEEAEAAKDGDDDAPAEADDDDSEKLPVKKTTSNGKKAAAVSEEEAEEPVAEEAEE